MARAKEGDMQMSSKSVSLYSPVGPVSAAPRFATLWPPGHQWRGVSVSGILLRSTQKLNRGVWGNRRSEAPWADFEMIAR